MVGERDRRREVEELRAGSREDAVADLGVLLDEAPLAVVERARLQQYVIGDSDLADVVERACDADQLCERLVEPEAPGDEVAVERNSLDVAADGAVAVLRGRRQSPHHFLLRPPERGLGAREARHGVEQLLLRPPPLCELAPQLGGQLRALDGERGQLCEARDQRLVGGREGAPFVHMREADDADDAAA